MTQETRTIEIPVYRDDEGRPVCHPGSLLGDHPECKMMKWGIYEPYCAYSEDYLRLSGGSHYRPTTNCPLWRDEVKK